MMDLARALRFGVDEPGPARLAFTGAGGKTTAMFQLARRLARVDPASGADSPSQIPVLVTTTTHLATPQLALADRVFFVDSPSDLELLDTQLSPGVILVAGTEGSAHRVSGPDPVSLQRLRDLAEARNLSLLIEADGSRQRPLKAPAEHEPAIPEFVRSVVVVAGLLGLEKPLTPAWVHRPGRFAHLAGLAAGEQISTAALARVLLHAQGGLKGIPPRARRVALLNQADTPELLVEASGLAGDLLGDGSYRDRSPAGEMDRGSRNGGYHAVLAAALASSTVWSTYEPSGGIVLAAGESRRFGSAKQILLWKGRPFVWHAARAALEAGLSPVVVVTGAYTAEVQTALEGLPVLLAHNPHWLQGQATSIQVGLQALPAKVKTAVFLLSDQPHIPPALLRSLVETHARTLSPLVAPRAGGRRANPVLFDAVTFPDLLALSGDTGGRLLFSKPYHYPAAWVEWEDERILMDVDTLEDFERMVRNFE
jgi:molybdenum cofactor cytidylyltransferase